MTNILEFLDEAESLNTLNFAEDFNVNLTSIYDLFNSVNLGIFYISQITNRNQFKIIDGYKRLTVVSLLLHAICECYKLSTAKNEDAIKKIQSKYLFSNDKPKLQINGKDGEIYSKLIFGQQLTIEEKMSEVFQCFHRFWTQIRNENISANELYNIIKNTKVIIIRNEQIDDIELFLGANSHRILNLAKLIETNILGYSLGNYHSETKKDFLKIFLTSNTNNETITDNNLYYRFFTYIESSLKYMTKDQIFENINKKFNHFIKILNTDFKQTKIKKLFEELNSNDGHRAYPYLLELIDEYENNTISEEVFEELLTTLNEYLQTNNSHNFDFSNLNSELNRRLLFS